MSRQNRAPPPQSAASRAPNYASRQNEYFVPRDGIDREVIQADICRYLGNDALVRPGWHEQIQGFYITAYRNLTSAMIEDLKADSARWDTERRRSTQRDYKSSDTYNLRQRTGPSDEGYHYDQAPPQQTNYQQGGYSQGSGNYQGQYPSGSGPYSGGSAYPPASGGGGYPGYNNPYPQSAQDPRYAGYGSAQGSYGAQDSMDVDMADQPRGQYAAAPDAQRPYVGVGANLQQRNPQAPVPNYQDHPKAMPREARDPYARDPRATRQDDSIPRDQYGRPFLDASSMTQAPAGQQPYGSNQTGQGGYPPSGPYIPQTSGSGNVPSSAAMDYSALQSSAYQDSQTYTTAMPLDPFHGRGPGPSYPKPPTPRSGAEATKSSPATAAAPTMMSPRDSDDFDHPNPPPRRPAASSPAVATAPSSKREAEYTTQSRPRDRDSRDDRHHKPSSHHNARR